MTRIVCIGDCHFGPQGGRNADRYAALDQIIEHGLRLNHLGAWLFAGDLNHAKMTIEDRNALAPRLQRMAEAAPILLIRGNHDLDGDPEIFTRLDTRWPIQYVTTAQVVTLKLATLEQAAIFCLPYIFKAELVSQGVAHGDLVQTVLGLLDPIFIDAAAKLQEHARNYDLPLMLGHLNIGGAIASTGQPSISKEIELDSALLARLGPIPKIFGHIHKHQAIHDAVYLGSITRQDFGEREDKCFGVLTFAADRSWSLNFEPLTVPAMHHVEGRLTREAFLMETIDGEPWPHVHGRRWDGADVRCRYRFVKAEISALDVAKVHAEFAGCRSLVLDPIAELEHSVRAPEIAAAVTLDAKVEAYAARQGLVLTEGMREKLTALQSPIGAERLLSLIAAELATVGRPGAPAPAADLAEVRA